eukprot:7737234-Pyramimonas_sp.AAC.1
MRRRGPGRRPPGGRALGRQEVGSSQSGRAPNAQRKAQGGPGSSVLGPGPRQRAEPLPPRSRCPSQLPRQPGPRSSRSCL